MTLIKRAMSLADSQPPHNDVEAPPVPPMSQGEREYLECIAEMRRRLEAAVRQ